jgi:integrase
MKEHISWLIGFTEIQMEEKNLNLMICVEERTKQIKSWAIGFQPITTQNLVRKLTNAIQKESNPLSLWVEEKRYQESKTYQSFLEDWVSRVKAEERDRTKKESIQHYLKMILESSVEGKTLSERLWSHKNLSGHSATSIVEDFIQKWNERKMEESASNGRSNQENEKLLEEVAKVEKRYAEVVEALRVDLIYEDKVKLTFLSKELEKLKTLVKGGNHSLRKLVEAKTTEMNDQLREIESKWNGVGMAGFPSEKEKELAFLLWDPIPESVFQLLVFNAASRSSYQKEIRKAQFKIGYSLLYFLGLRVNELRFVTLEEIEGLLEGRDLRVNGTKSYRFQNSEFGRSGMEHLKELEPEVKLLRKEKKFQYLFGKSNPPHPKTLIRILNEDIQATCQLCDISEKITSHSFRISLISKLLKVTPLEEVIEIMGYKDIRSPSFYKQHLRFKSRNFKKEIEG